MKMTDGQSICAHNWNRLFLNGEQVQQPLLLQEFLQAKVYDCLSPIWLGDIIAYMRLYPDLFDRFIVQIYHEEE